MDYDKLIEELVDTLLSEVSASGRPQPRRAGFTDSATQGDKQTVLPPSVFQGRQDYAREVRRITGKLSYREARLQQMKQGPYTPPEDLGKDWEDVPLGSPLPVSALTQRK